jgi:excisionase family DNA binding protein
MPDMRNGSSESELLTLPEASRLLRVQVSTLRAWRCQRRLPFHKIGRKVMLKRSDVQAFIDASVVPSANDLRKAA